MAPGVLVMFMKIIVTMTMLFCSHTPVLHVLMPMLTVLSPSLPIPMLLPTSVYCPVAVELWCSRQRCLQWHSYDVTRDRWTVRDHRNLFTDPRLCSDIGDAGSIKPSIGSQ